MQVASIIQPALSYLNLIRSSFLALVKTLLVKLELKLELLTVRGRHIVRGPQYLAEGILDPVLT